jgi:aspartyl-tRNA(Asn)/glutamyl-tRNA(Gln) amidotransferase subunit A
LYQHHSIRQFHQEVANGTIECTQVVQHYLSRISATSHLNAFVEVFNEEALERASELDQKKRSGASLGKLFGVVIGIKDVICYKGHKVTAASRILEGFTSLYSATAVERLLAEDAIIIGSLNCDEFAMGSSNEHSAYGKVLNALDESRVPGGSSGGSAVAVQAGLCMVSLGSDTGGSVRQPADFCGIIGLKPTYGRISRHGLIAYASSFDQIGIFSTSVDDAALLLEVMAGADEFDSTVSSEPVPSYSQQLTTSEKYRIAYFEESLEHPSLDPEIKTATYYLFQQLRDQGHTVSPVSFEFLDYIVPTYYVLTTAEASSNLSRYDGVKYGPRIANPSGDLTSFYQLNRSAGFGKEVKRRIMLGNFVLSSGYYDAYFTQAQKVRRLIINKTDEVFRDHDLLLMPTVPAPAFPFGDKSKDPIEMFLADLFTVYANLSGIPAISIPLSNHSNGMPFGVQIMTNRFKELTLLRASKSFPSPVEPTK